MNVIVHIINTRIKYKSGIPERKKINLRILLVRRAVIFKNLLSVVSFCSLKISKSVEYALKRKRIKDLLILSSIKY